MIFVMIIGILIVVGYVMSFINHRYINVPWGRLRPQARVYGFGAVIVLEAWLISIILFLEWFGLDGYDASDQIPDLFLIPLEPSIGLNILVFFIVLSYPVYYLIGAGLEQRYSKHAPAVGDPAEDLGDRSIIVIADTHLGLRPNVYHDATGEGSDSDVNAISTFIDWLIETSGGSPDEAIDEIPAWKGGEVKEDHQLRHPKYIVLLGDILEMWDGLEESVQLDMATTFSKLNRVGKDTEVVYVVGNHDQVLLRDRTSLDKVDNKDVAEGEDKKVANFTVARDVWPGAKMPGGLDMHPIKAGRRQYLFLHGHQFGWWFRNLGLLTHIPGHLRRAARLGHYSWLLLLLVIGVLVFHDEVKDWEAAEVMILFLLAFLLVPIGFILFARTIYRWFASVRYDNLKGLKSFGQWWRMRAGGGKDDEAFKPSRDLAIVYGHTHISDIVGSKKAASRGYSWSKKMSDPDEMPLMLNLPSWTKDYKTSRERCVFLYIDPEGYMFLGWDWTERRPFHIPSGLIIQLRDGKDSKQAIKDYRIDREDLKDLRWPEVFKEIWFTKLWQSK